MSAHGRRRMMSVVALLLCVAAAGKIIKAVYRGETMQARVKPLN